MYTCTYICRYACTPTYTYTHTNTHIHKYPRIQCAFCTCHRTGQYDRRINRSHHSALLSHRSFGCKFRAPHSCSPRRDQSDFAWGGSWRGRSCNCRGVVGRPRPCCLSVCCALHDAHVDDVYLSLCHALVSASCLLGRWGLPSVRCVRCMYSYRGREPERDPCASFSRQTRRDVKRETDMQRCIEGDTER